jgi:hypothetical protein
MTPREFLLAHGSHIARMMGHANRLSAAEFAKRYGVRLPEARSIVARFREIYCMPEYGKEAGALVRRLACIFERSRES